MGKRGSRSGPGRDRALGVSSGQAPLVLFMWEKAGPLWVASCSSLPPPLVQFLLTPAGTSQTQRGTLTPAWGEAVTPGDTASSHQLSRAARPGKGREGQEGALGPDTAGQPATEREEQGSGYCLSYPVAKTLTVFSLSSALETVPLTAGRAAVPPTRNRWSRGTPAPLPT